jgi:phosphoglycolate phosphatase
MAYRAVIFDLDGTLADTLADIADTMNRTLAACGYPLHTHDVYRFFVGKGIWNLVSKSLPANARTEQIIQDCHNRMIADYEQHYINKTRLYGGIPELLSELSRRGVKLAVLSNKADAITQKICDTLLQSWRFEVVLGFNTRFPRKPDPQAALFIAEKMGVAPANVCYLGDSDVDMQTANAAGFFAVGVSWGFRPKEELISSGAHQIIDFPTELLQIII